MEYYNIHNLISIVVDPNLHHKSLSHLQSLIGHFKCQADSDTTKKRIHILPYHRHSQNPQEVVRFFGSYQGELGLTIHNPVDKIIIQKNKNGFVIYQDKGRIPIYMFLQLLLAEMGISLVSAAAISDANGRVTLLVGSGGAGKSSLSIELVRNHEFNMLGDDTVCIDRQGTCFSFPRVFTIKEYNRHDYGKFIGSNAKNERIKSSAYIKEITLRSMRLIRDNAPFLGVLNYLSKKMNLEHLHPLWIPSFALKQKTPAYTHTIAMEEIVGPKSIIPQGTIDRVIYLERFSKVQFIIEKLDPLLLCRRLVSTINNEWALNMRLFFTMSAYDMVNLQNHFNQVAEIISDAVAKRSCHQLFIPKHTHPEPLCEYFLANFN